jgi:hypothetical protein
LTLIELMASDTPRYELRQPIPGMRHNKTEKLVPHRFPIKGGLTYCEVVARTVTQNNALFSMLVKRAASGEAN